ncbi:hypothetical protein [Devosia nitrariae]|uniref:Uncharacterized protein n=1 Tax=Devosia nitrariae TaxID=2071872 RepID=A0ABQ5W6Q7_9HYPH|nr:hypothetical protein [Devosia nitrariae]GLQ55321.1 hypothetical protein GCM10010862_25800 [Devosia nitrariae]
MREPEKPNVDIEKPEEKPSLEDLGRGPAERAVLGRDPRLSTLRIVGAIALFILVFGTLFYYLTR